MANYIENIENILSREEYLAACKSNEVSNYRERVVSEVFESIEPYLFVSVRETLQGYLGTAFQQLVDATPEEIEVLERDDTIYDHNLTLEEQREIVLKASFDSAFQKLKGRLQRLLDRYNQQLSVSASL